MCITRTSCAQDTACATDDVVRTLVEEAIGTVQELEAFGVEFEKENGDYLVSQGCFGSLPRNYNLRGHGTNIIRALKNALNQNTQILENVMITELLVQNRRCVGAVALTPEGGVTVIRAGAGGSLPAAARDGCSGYSLNPKEMTGDSYALGYLAGAELMNMEFMQVGMGVLAPGTSILNSWIWSLHPEGHGIRRELLFSRQSSPDGVHLRSGNGTLNPSTTRSAV